MQGSQRQQLGLVVDVFTLVKDSDGPVLLVSQPRGMWTCRSHIFSGSQRHTVGSVWAHSVGTTCTEQVESMCEKTGS